MSDDKPKKSWRERDRANDSSSHRRDEKAPVAQARHQKSAAYRNYKSQLNKLFDGGEMPAALKDKLGETETGKVAKRRKELTTAIVDAVKPRQVQSALREFRAEMEAFPADEEVLKKLIDLDDEEIVLEALDVIAALHREGTLKRASSFKARLKTVKMTLDAPAVVRRVDSLLAKL